jgi:hypothetical protein
MPCRELHILYRGVSHRRLWSGIILTELLNDMFEAPGIGAQRRHTDEQKMSVVGEPIQGGTHQWALGKVERLLCLVCEQCLNRVF